MCKLRGCTWLGATLNDRLQKLQNRAARVITRSTYDISSSYLLNELQWNSLSIEHQNQKAVVIFKTLNGQTPQYLEQMFNFHAEVGIMA